LAVAGGGGGFYVGPINGYAAGVASNTYSSSSTAGSNGVIVAGASASNMPGGGGGYDGGTGGGGNTQTGQAGSGGQNWSAFGVTAAGSGVTTGNSTDSDKVGLGWTQTGKGSGCTYSGCDGGVIVWY
jgi:hypothetical protein